MANKIWTVLNPVGMNPELGDCVFSQTPKEQARHIVGMGLAEYELRNPALYDNEVEAMEDFGRRLEDAVDNYTSLRGRVNEFSMGRRA